MWFLVAGAFGAFLIYVKGKKDQKKETELEGVQEDLEGLKRLKDVKTNTDVDSALERLQSNGKLRD
jgi:predicted SpoU family rRNA methylase